MSPAGWELVAKVVPHEAQRYETCGDWQTGHFGTPHVLTISQCGNETYEFLVLLHELIEFWLCRVRDIPQETVDAWDMQYPGEDPGADPGAPYYREHMYATYIESLVAHELGVDPIEYEMALGRI